MILLFGASIRVIDILYYRDIIRVKFNLYEMQDSHFKNSKISIFTSITSNNVNLYSI